MTCSLHFFGIRCQLIKDLCCPCKGILLAVKPIYCLLTAAYCAAIFFFSSSINPVSLPDTGFSLDKVAHAVLYAGLAATVSVGIRRSRPTVRPWVQFVVPIVFAALYAVSDELHQYFVPGRYCDFKDILADVTGAILIQVVLCGFVWRIRCWGRASARSSW